MKIPNIEEEFSQRFLSGPRYTLDQTLMSSGAPLFVQEEVVASTHPLDVLLRSIFVKKKITKEYFSQQCRKYAIEVMGLMSSAANTPGSNLIRALKQGNISWMRFFEALAVLNLSIEDMSIKLSSINGEVETINLLESLEKYKA